MFDLGERFHVAQSSETGGLFVVDSLNEFDSEYAGMSLWSAENLKRHRNGRHQDYARALCRACRETPGMILPLPHDPASGFGDPNLSLGTA